MGNARNGDDSCFLHHGVLFLDELPEFKKDILEMLRQPMEDNEVTISRALMTLSHPAGFMLISAMNMISILSGVGFDTLLVRFLWHSKRQNAKINTAKELNLYHA